MTLRNSKFTPIAFWLAFLALGFITGFAGSSHPARKTTAVAERETVRPGASAQD